MVSPELCHGRCVHRTPTIPAPILTDLEGKRYARIAFPLGMNLTGRDVEGRLTPDHPFTDVLLFEAPDEEIKEMHLELPGKALGIGEPIRFAIPATMIVAGPNPVPTLPPVEHTNSIGMKFRLIPAGEFMMGSSQDEVGRDDDEGPQHRVRITKPYYLGIHEVTQAQWTKVMGTAPWRGQANAEHSPEYPATYVSWQETQTFVDRLSTEEKRTYRLPTEAEWEYACRAGMSGVYGFGDDTSRLGEHARYGKKGFVGGKSPFIIGQDKPNRWGLYDMHGNVREWCQDGYDSDYYAYSGFTDPRGGMGGSNRVTRGGSWASDASSCRSAHRKGVLRQLHYCYLGFRVAISLSD